jgi:hypothetical protein
MLTKVLGSLPFAFAAILAGILVLQLILDAGAVTLGPAIAVAIGGTFGVSLRRTFRRNRTKPQA